MSDTQNPFGPEEEKGIISLILDFPELYAASSEFIIPPIFDNVIAQYVIAAIHEDYKKTGHVPSRQLLKDRLSKKLTVEDPYQEIFELIDRPSNPRDVPFIKDEIHKWIEKQTYSLLYSDEAIEAHSRGDFEHLRKIVESADKLKHTGQKGFWLFDEIDELFVEKSIDHISTGFPSLDKILNGGGPSKKEVVLWLAPTGVGKCVSKNTKIIEKRLSNVYEIEYENGKKIYLRGYKKVFTTAGLKRVCDLQPDDHLTRYYSGNKYFNFEINDDGDISFENKVNKAD